MLSSVAALLLFLVLYAVLHTLFTRLRSSIRQLRGPCTFHFFYGDLKQIWAANGPTIQEKWVEEYGITFRYKGPLYSDRLFTMDTKAINHVLMNSGDYWKPEAIRYTASRIFGTGLLIVEGDKHRHQRRIVNPAFGQAQIRALTEIFVSKANQLRDLWMSEILEQGQGSAPIEVMSWLSKAALDIIGLAGFNYRFDALEAKPDSNYTTLSKSFGVVFRTHGQLRLFPVLRSLFPFLRGLPQTSRDKVKDFAREKMTGIGQQFLNESKSAFVESGGLKSKPSAIDDAFLEGRDLLSLLIRANMSRDIPVHQRLSDEDVLAQVSTFIVTGHETTSTALTWALFALTQAPAVQSKLRQELLSLTSENPTMDELNSLPYLDCVMREIARLHPPVPETIRVAMKDDILPLATPVVDKHGVERDYIPIRKGDTISIPILAMNRCAALWGKDAKEFRPERWESIPEAANSVPGVWGNTLTFLGGPRNCIAYRFSLVEMKAILFVLIRSFEFELAVPVADVVKKSSIVVRPMISTTPGNKCQLPMLVRPCTTGLTV